jgi:hypothetical protein
VFEMSQQSIFTLALLRKEHLSIKDLFVTCRPHVTSVPSLSPGSVPGLSFSEGPYPNKWASHC